MAVSIPPKFRLWRWKLSCFAPKRNENNIFLRIGGRSPRLRCLDIWLYCARLPAHHDEGTRLITRLYCLHIVYCLHIASFAQTAHSVAVATGATRTASSVSSIIWNGAVNPRDLTRRDLSWPMRRPSNGREGSSPPQSPGGRTMRTCVAPCWLADSTIALSSARP